MIIYKHNFDWDKLSGIPDSEIVREILSPNRKPNIKEAAVRDESINILKQNNPGYEAPLQVPAPKAESPFLVLKEHVSNTGGEIFSPDSKTFVSRTNVPGFCIVGQETPSGDVTLSVRNQYGNIISSLDGVRTTKQFESFMQKEGLALSKNTAIALNLSSSAVYFEIRR